MHSIEKIRRKQKYEGINKDKMLKIMNHKTSASRNDR